MRLIEPVIALEVKLYEIISQDHVFRNAGIYACIRVHERNKKATEIDNYSKANKNVQPLLFLWLVVVRSHVKNCASFKGK